MATAALRRPALLQMSFTTLAKGEGETRHGSSPPPGVTQIDAN